METEKDKFLAECSWSTDGKDVGSTISFGDYNERSNEEEDLNRLVEVETCICLSKPEESENTPCSLHITCKDPTQKIRKVCVISEARIVELYGHFGEYLKTVKAENIEEIGEMFVNVAQAEVSPVQEITLKFAGLKSGISSMWLYGIHISLKAGPPMNPTGNFNYQNVEERLKTAKVPITEKAERCKRFLQQYTNITNSYAGKQPDAQTLLRMLEEDCLAQLKPLNEAGRNVSKYLSDFLPALNTRKDPEQGKEPLDLKQYIDTSVQKLELRMTDYFDRRLKEFEEKQNEKLERIMMMLKDR